MEGDLEFTGFFPVVAITLSNLALFEKLRELLDINVEQIQRSKWLLYGVFFCIHILTYSFMGPLAWWKLFVPVFPAVILAGAVSIYLVKTFDFFTENVKKTEVEENVIEGTVKETEDEGDFIEENVEKTEDTGSFTEDNVVNLSEEVWNCTEENFAKTEDDGNYSVEESIQKLEDEGTQKSETEINENVATTEDGQAFSDFLNALGLNKSQGMTVVDGWTVKDLFEATMRSSDVLNTFLVKISAQDPNATLELSEHFTNCREVQRRFSPASSRDILFALFTCCDPILLQEVLRKVSSSGNAVPLLLPDCVTKEVKLLLWGLRNTIFSWIGSKTNLIHDISVTKCPFLTISAIRLGEISISKSDVLNKLLAISYGCMKRDSFLSFSQDPHQSMWSVGTVECDWFISEKLGETKEKNTSFALLNLRGNGRLHVKQVQLCAKISNILLIFANSVTEDELKVITENVEHAVLMSCSSNVEEEVSIQPNARLSVVHIRNDNLTRVSKNLLDIVKEKGAVAKGVQIESISQICDNLAITVDENCSDHQDAKSLACETIETLTSEENQREENKCLPDFSLKCLRAIKLSNVDVTLYFAWLKMLLRYKNETSLAPLLKEFVLISQKLCDIYQLIHTNETASSSEHKISKDLEKQIEDQIVAMRACMKRHERFAITIHHFIKKLEHHARGKQRLADTPVESFAQTIATSLLRGIPLEILESESCEPSTDWLNLVFENLNKICQTGNTVRVVSILGGLSSFKSTLLNSLFGTNFQVGIGKCSQGILMQLVPVDGLIKKTLGCDFLVIVDTQGLSFAEGKFLDLFDRNDRIVRTCCCISDVVIVSTRGSVPETYTNNILEAVTAGLIKVKEANRSAKCLLVQHKVDGTFRESDRDQKVVCLFEQLKFIIRKTTKIEEKEHMFDEMLNVFCSKDETNIRVIPPRIGGPDSLRSEQYSQSIINLRHDLLQMVAKQHHPSLTFIELNQLLVHVKEHYFQSTNTETLNAKLIEQYRKKLLTVRQELMGELSIASDGITTSGYESIDKSEEKAKKHIVGITDRKYKELEERVKGMLQSRRYKILKEQLHYFLKDLFKAKEDFFKEVEIYFKRSIQKAKQDLKVQSECKEFVLNVHELTQSTDKSGDEIEKTLNLRLSNHLAELKRKYRPLNQSEVRSKVESSMENMLRRCGKQVETLTIRKPLSKFSMNFHQGNTIEDINNLKRKFNIVEDSHTKMLNRISFRLEQLSNDHTNFDRNSQTVVELIIQLERELNSVVENITLYLFLSSKFICRVHRSQLQMEDYSKVKVKNFSFYTSGKPETDLSESYVNEFWSKKYTMKRFLTLRSKIEHLLTRWKYSISQGNFRILQQVLTDKNIQNCDRLPFTFLTLQRLDRCFIDSIPELSCDDMTTINNAVNDAKLVVFSKALTKACLDLKDTFEQIKGTIESSVLVESDKDKVQAAALAHLSAWSVGVLSIKSYEDQSINNVAGAFVKSQGVFETTFKATLNENCYEEIAEVVCGAIHNALIDTIQREIVNNLRASFLSNHDLFNVKRAFIGTVLRDLCQQDDYRGFVSFLKNYDWFSQKWILKFLAKECNKVKDSLLQKIVQELIRDKRSAVISALQKNLSDFQKREEKTFSIWLSLLYRKLLIYSTTLNQGEYFDALKDNIKVTNFQAFTNNLISKVNKLDFQESLHLPEVGNEDDTKTWLLSEGGDLHRELSKVIKGCIHQCPFCGAACENTLEEHDSHKTALHNPPGINGWRYIETQKLVPEICTANVASDRTYIKTPLDKPKPYKEYKKDFPDWDIPADDDQPMEFWKFIFSKFNKKFAILHDCLKGEVPKEWFTYSKEDAINSVELAYHISPI